MSSTSNGFSPSNEISNRRISIFIGGLSYFIDQSNLKNYLNSLFSGESPKECERQNHVKNPQIEVYEVELKHKHYLKSSSEGSIGEDNPNNSVVLYAKVTFQVASPIVSPLEDCELVTELIIDKINNQRFMGKLLA